MDNVRNLEESIQKLIDAGIRLKKERDEAIRKAEKTRREIDDARKTIENLKDTIGNQGLPESRPVDNDRTKKEIIKKLKIILSQIDSFIDIHKNTNDQD